MQKTRIWLQPNGTIGIKIGKLGEELNWAHKALVEKLSIRRFNRHNNIWTCPFEIHDEIRRKLAQDPGTEWDSELLDRYAKLYLLNEQKYNGLPPHPQYSLEDLKTTPLIHQEKFLNYALNFKAVANTCEQGTGKSKMGLDYLTLKNVHIGLIVCRNSNCYKWSQEIKKHSEFLPIVLKGSRQERLEKIGWGMSRDSPVLFIINYEYVVPFFKVLKQIKFEAYILDESTAIKSPRSKRHKALVKLGESVKYRMIMSGTPLINNPMDGYGQLRFMNPNILGKNFSSFQNRYAVLGGFGGYQIQKYINLDELSAKIDSHSFRVLKTECLDLPPKTFHPLVLEPDAEFAKGYKKIVESVLLELGDQMKDNSLAIVKMQRCMQYCDGFLYSDSATMTYTEHKTPKMKELLDFMTEHYKTHTKLIIWFGYRATGAMLEREIQKKFGDKISTCLMRGGVSPSARQDNIDSFNISSTINPENQCLILQTASFMHGIDLRSTNSYYYSRTFSNEEWQQSQDRTHGINRGGDTKSTYYISRIAGTIEDTIDAALIWKKSISDLILRDGIAIRNIMEGVNEKGISR